MVDFSKLIEKRRVVDVSDPLKLFESLDRKSSHTELRPAQIEALKELGQRRNERDLVLKLSTGAGKTTVALLYLKSHMAEKGRTGVYLCPTTQLVSQVVDEASKLGIEAVTYPAGESLPGAEGMSGRAVIVCTYDKLFNAKTTFDRPDVLLRPCAIVLDDAHAGVEEIRDAFTLRLAGDELHEKLLNIIRSSCESYQEGIWAPIENKDPEAFLEVPYWLWKPIVGEIQRLLAPHSDDEALRFVWPHLRDILRWCRCIVSGLGIEIVPDIMPVEKVKAFDEAKHRLFTSATLADDSTLVRELGCALTAAEKPITPPIDKGLGERMVLAPTLVDKSLNRAWVMDWCKKLSKKVRVVVLSPSEKLAREWEEFGAKVVLRDSVPLAIKGLKNESKNHRFVVFVQRYDGVDLPDSACRILVIDGMPYGEGIADKHDSGKLGVPGGTRNRLIYRIEQGMGRAVRSHADYAVVILAGPELANFIAKREVLDMMNPGTKAQLELAQGLAKFAMEQDKEPADALNEMLNQCLNRDEGWKQFYNERVRAIAQTLPSHTSVERLHLADAERQAFRAAQANDFIKAIEHLRKAISEYIKDEKESGWFLQKIANYKYEIDPGKALEIQRSAHEKNYSLFRSPRGTTVRPLDASKIETPALILDWIKTFQNPNGALAELEELRARLSYDASSTVLEEAIKQLAKLLGAVGSRPEKEHDEGPDGLWLWPDTSLVIEVKNDREQALPKKDAGQLHDSLQWFKRTYPNREDPIPVVVAKVSTSDSKAHFPEGTRVLTPEKMKELLENLETFLGAVISELPLLTKPKRIAELQSQFGLSPKQFIERYTVKLK